MPHASGTPTPSFRGRPCPWGTDSVPRLYLLPVLTTRSRPCPPDCGPPAGAALGLQTDDPSAAFTSAQRNQDPLNSQGLILQKTYQSLATCTFSCWVTVHTSMSSFTWTTEFWGMEIRSLTLDSLEQLSCALHTVDILNIYY